MDGSDLFYLTGTELVSHNCWMMDSNIISFSKTKDGRNKYNLYSDKEGFKEIIGENDFFEDGHPSVSNGRWMITDTYQISQNFQVYICTTY